MKYKELYDAMLDECSETCPTCESYGASRILEEMDPVAYRCGFSDWTYSLRDSPPVCGCGREVSDFDVCMDDDVECGVCKGDDFECGICGDVFPKDEHPHHDKDMCNECYEEAREAEEEDE